MVKQIQNKYITRHNNSLISKFNKANIKGDQNIMFNKIMNYIVAIDYNKIK